MKMEGREAGMQISLPVSGSHLKGEEVSLPTLFFGLDKRVHYEEPKPISAIKEITCSMEKAFRRETHLDLLLTEKGRQIFNETQHLLINMSIRYVFDRLTDQVGPHFMQSQIGANLWLRSKRKLPIDAIPLASNCHPSTLK